MFIHYFVISLFILHEALATTEWFGDLRAQLNPPRSPPFYDVTYDDTGCYLLSCFILFNFILLRLPTRLTKQCNS